MLSMQRNALAHEGDQPWLFPTPHREAQRTAGEVPDERLASAGHELAVELVLVVGEWVHGVQDEGVLGFDQFLHQDGHVQVVETSSGFREGNPWPQREERGPHAFDGLPRVARIEELLQTLLTVTSPDLRHLFEQTFFQCLGHRHGVDEILSLLEDKLRLVIAGARLQAAQDLLQLLEHLLAIDLVGQGLLHATIGEGHSLRCQDLLRQLRLQQGQVQTLRADFLLVHLIGPDDPIATQGVGEIHLHLRVGSSLGIRLGCLRLGRVALGPRLGLHGEGAVGLAPNLDPLALEIFSQTL
mmetsp:Transcript_51926/g.131243  ORF Transcript_51926/g.131243 Transcript_51926/m.131243 type:complete len:298 (+) Transcript_51926:385-1278(+)